ncbi:DUF4386 domain-containing protein [Rhizohabitans arisaemae]|uniref:DUF4386 domain-containing protein n=1 Tax=Rhizohabitans arisaemae TaxID=2720610 RepID=UPI0024B06972|nr:DUF4386 domain-containing protein [Rhizohabitans arisaemae]
MTTPKTLARIAGVLYLLVAAFNIFAGLVNTRIVESGDAAATADNIGASATLFRLGFVGELVGATVFLLLGLALYLLLNHVNRFAAAAMAVFVAVGAAIQGLNALNRKAALTIATGQDHAGAFGPAGSDQLTMLFADLHHDGYLIAQMYFGLWLLPLGYLIVKSGYFPKALGVLMVIGCSGHLVDMFARFLAPGIAANISPFAMTPPAVAEISLIVWLLVKAVRVPVPDVRAASVAHSGSG